MQKQNIKLLWGKDECILAKRLKLLIAAVTYERTFMQVIKKSHSHHKHIRICGVMG